MLLHFEECADFLKSGVFFLGEGFNESADDEYRYQGFVPVEKWVLVPDF